MPPYIGERLLNHTKEDEFDIGGHAPEIRRQVQINTDRGSLRKPIEVRSQSDTQPSPIEQWRMKQIGDGPDLRDGSFQNILEFDDDRAAGRRS